MDKLLKGNYEVAGLEKLEKRAKEESSTDDFEEQAMQKLGGSIAFVTKGNKLIFDEEEDEA